MADSTLIKEGVNQFDPPEILEQKLSKLKELVLNSKYMVVYTGAGISTASNIPDFRGEGGLLSGKGILGLKEHLLDAIQPTFSHLAITEMLKKGFIKFVVTSNHDNLHEKAGTSPSQIAELFGNAYIEKCLKCQTLYRRDIVVPNLGRNCEKCGARLVKTGVRFGQAVPTEPLETAKEQSKKADFGLVLGSGMAVSPFCDMPMLVGGIKHRNIAVCSIQETPVDNGHGVLKINARCDDVMRYLAKELSLTISDYTYEQPFNVGHSLVPEQNPRKWRLFVEGAKVNEPPSCIESVKVKFSKSNGATLEDSMVENRSKNYEVVVSDAEITDGVMKYDMTIHFKEEFEVAPLSISYVIDPNQTEHSQVHKLVKTIHVSSPQ